MCKSALDMTYSSKITPLSLVLIIITTVLLGSCTKEEEKDQPFTIGLITNNRNGLKNIQGFQDKMTELGYNIGKNVNYMFEETPVKGSKLDDSLNEMVKAEVDLIFTAGTPTGVAAHKITAGTNIPVIFGVIANPIRAGVMEDLAKPGGNMTGVKLGATQARRLQFLLELTPDIKRILIPYNSKDTASTSAVAQIRDIAPSLNIEIVEKTAHNDQEVLALLACISENLDAIFLVPGTTVNIHLQKVLAAAHDHKIPVSGPSLTQVKEGALTSFGFDHHEAGMQAARLADQVLKGADPGDLPVETAEFFLALNLITAETLGLQIPYSALQQAKVIIRADSQ